MHGINQTTGLIYPIVLYSQWISLGVRLLCLHTTTSGDVIATPHTLLRTTVGGCTRLMAKGIEGTAATGLMNRI